MIKNKYLLREEVKNLIDSLPTKHNSLKQIILLIYEQGYSVAKAVEEAGRGKSIRAFQKLLSNRSTITLADLKRSYKIDNPSLLKKKINKRKPINPRLRWIILERDGFRCQACGAHSRDTLLHIDHIRPVSAGGLNEPTNLRTLCSECNMGRGNIILKLTK